MSELESIANDLHKWAGLLNGVSEIARGEFGEDAHGDRFNVAAFACDTINSDLCRIADRLNAIAMEGGAT
jgi:hypothetical protein